MSHMVPQKTRTQKLAPGMCAKKRKADFKAIKKYGVPVNKTDKGRSAIALKDWQKKAATKTAPSVTTDDIDIWTAE
eukprot:7466182-Pyramimonas_sp.AAC.1